MFFLFVLFSCNFVVEAEGVLIELSIAVEKVLWLIALLAG